MNNEKPSPRNPNICYWLLRCVGNLVQKKPFVWRLDPELLKAIENGLLNSEVQMGNWNGLLLALEG